MAPRKTPRNLLLVKMGAQLRVLRTKRPEGKLSLEEMEARTGISKSALSRIEKGQQEAGPSDLAPILQVLGKSLSQFFVDLEHMPQAQD